MPVTTGTWYATSADSPPGTPLSDSERQRLTGQPAGGEHVLERGIGGGGGLIEDCHHSSSRGAGGGRGSVKYPLGSLAGS